jgi:hypothetical protein
MVMKQTSVEWLVEQLEQHYTSIDIKNTVVFQQAKAMEKEQMDKVSEDWWVEACSYMDANKRIYESFEQYYNETYGKE